MAQEDSEEQGLLYFAYGSNLSTTQMRDRCPRSTPIGLAHLDAWTWIINERGYANIVPNEAAREAEASDDSSSDKPSQSPGVYGLVYRLHPDDERMLDVYEGVGFAYDRQRLKVVWTASDALPETELKILIHGTGESEVLVYVDSARITPSTPKEEYIGRMNVGIEESRLPTSYVNDVIRPYIPAPGKYAVGTRKGVHHSHKVSAAREK